MDPLEQIVELRRLGATLSDPEQRRRLARVVRALRASLPAGIPKRRAARLLGVSPQALERWVRAGEVPTVRRPGSSRELVETTALLRLLRTVAELRDQGDRRPLAAALRALQLRRRPGPNPTARELRRDYRRTSPEYRVREGIPLSEFGVTMAAHGRRLREERRG